MHAGLSAESWFLIQITLLVIFVESDEPDVSFCAEKSISDRCDA